MKIERRKLQDALRVAQRVTKSGANLPILKCVLIDGPKQRIVGTDLETYVSIPISIKDWKKPVNGAVIPAAAVPAATTSVVTPGVPPDLAGKQKAELLEMALFFGKTVPKKTKVDDIKAIILEAWHANNPEEAPVKSAEPVWIEESFVIDASELKKITDSLETDEIEIIRSTGNAEPQDGEQQGTMFKAEYAAIGGYFQGLPVYPAEDFPVLPGVSGGKVVTEIKREALEHVLLAAASSGDNNTLNWVYMHASSAVATDGHRMHMVEAVNSEDVAEAGWILNGAAAHLITSISKESTLSFKIKDEKWVVCKTGDITVVTMLVDGKFPDYKTVVPAAKEKGWKTITVTRESVEKAFRQAKILLDDKTPGVKLRFNSGIDVFYQNASRGKYERTNIAVEGSVDPAIEVGVNVGYLLDAVKTAPEEKTPIQIRVKAPDYPVILENPAMYALVMPMRI